MYELNWQQNAQKRDCAYSLYRIAKFHKFFPVAYIYSGIFPQFESIKKQYRRSSADMELLLQGIFGISG